MAIKVWRKTAEGAKSNAPAPPHCVRQRQEIGS